MRSRFSCKVVNGTLKMYEEKIWSWNNNPEGHITLYIPKDMDLKEIEIDNEAGRVEVDGIFARKLDLSHGAGTIRIVNSNFDKVNIEGGAGKIEIASSVLNNMKLSAGVGKVKIDAELLGDNRIECGVGGVELLLKGSKEDYRINTEKGIGSIKIGGESISNDSTYGDGKNTIRIEGGIGSINIDFED